MMDVKYIYKEKMAKKRKKKKRNKAIIQNIVDKCDFCCMFLLLLHLVNG